jgi:hypothetical protein
MSTCSSQVPTGTLAKSRAGLSAAIGQVAKNAASSPARDRSLRSTRATHPSGGAPVLALRIRPLTRAARLSREARG